jgi:3-methyladenine DNA glycosylase/8-oxoguanine DNA glycosylase
MSMPKTKINLSVPKPFSLDRIIHSHGWIQLAPFNYEKGADRFSYTIRLTSGEVSTFTINESISGIDITLIGELSPTSKKELLKKISWMLALDIDLSDFYKLASQEPKLAHIPKNAAGRILRSATLFEDTVKTILTTNTSWSGTIRMVKALVDQYGESNPSNPELRAFPTSSALARLSEHDLRSNARLGYRAPYILELAQSVESNQIDLESFTCRAFQGEDIYKYLIAIKGIGTYAAASLSILLGDYKHLPIDSWALKMVSEEWYGGKPIEKKEVEDAFEIWGQWKGLVYWYWNWSNQVQ